MNVDLKLRKLLVGGRNKRQLACDLKLLTPIVNYLYVGQERVTNP